MRAIKIQHTEDPAVSLQREIGDISWLNLFGPQVLVATYMPGDKKGREVKTEGGIILTQQSLQEYEYQGKVGLVLATGPLAFQDSADGRYKFGGKQVAPGDWVLYRASDGFPLLLDQHHCRLLQDVQILAVIPNPDRVY